MHSHTPELRFRKAWLAVGYCLVVLVVYLTVAPEPQIDIPGDEGDKAGHLLAYATLMLWFAQLYRGGVRRVLIAIAFVIMGIALEFVQLLEGTRTFDYFDMAANSFGVLLAYAAAPPRLPNFLRAVESMIGRVSHKRA